MEPQRGLTYKIRELLLIRTPVNNLTSKEDRQKNGTLEFRAEDRGKVHRS